MSKRSRGVQFTPMYLKRVKKNASSHPSQVFFYIHKGSLNNALASMFFYCILISTFNIKIFLHGHEYLT